MVHPLFIRFSIYTCNIISKWYNITRHYSEKVLITEEKENEKAPEISK